jgi:phospholipid/cholesterol/gamma-HCH transport system permease protein
VQASARDHAAGDPAATAEWAGGGGRWTLVLRGDWRGGATHWPAAPAAAGAADTVAFDGAALRGWDTALAARLWALERELRPRGTRVDTAALPAGLREVLALAAPQRAALDDIADLRDAGETGETGARDGRAVPHPARRAPAPAAVTVAFFGEVLFALGRWLRGGSGVRAADVLRQLDETGPRSLPIVLLTCALVGLMLAYMGGAQLGRIGAQSFVASVVTVGMVRELAGLMTGVILAGRVGSAFAAQLATMQAGEEIDALRVLGVDPIAHLVLPRLLGLLLMAPVLIGFGALAGVLAGWPAALWVYGVTSAEYLHQCLRALNFTHLWIGMFKGMLYVALVALAGCREGLHAGRSAQAVGAATTAAVVKALVWIVMAACLTTVVFTSLGL